MKIVKLETFLTNAGLRNYLFVRLTTDTGLTGIGEASMEWKERAIQSLLHDWVEDRILGVNPFDIEKNVAEMIRDQYQGGPVVMAAISSVEVAMWDIVGKECGQPVYRLLGGRCHDRLSAYANGWYGGANKPVEYGEKARDVLARGYGALKFDPFGTAWKEMSPEEMDEAEARVAAVREVVGDSVGLMIEVHGRLSVAAAIEMGQRLTRYKPAWYEEPVTPHSLDFLKEVKESLEIPIAAGERLTTLEDFSRMIQLRAVDVVQMDPAYCGGLSATKKIAAMAAANDIQVAPHCSIGPVALCAALHVDWSTPNVAIQECFAEYDVPWRNDLVGGWNPIENGHYALPEKPGLGIELNTAICEQHPYKKHSFRSLWDEDWVEEFTWTD